MQEADIKAQINGLREQLRRQPSARRLSSPTRRAASPGRARAASPGRAPPAAPGSGGAVGRKSDCVMRVEEMKRQREERRKRAEEAKARRAVEAKDAESRGGIESVDFLRKIREYREAHGLAAAPAPWAGGDVWGEAGRIRVCVRKRPMLKIEELRHDFDVVTCEPSGTSLVVHEPKTRVDLAKAIESQRFACDAVFNEADSNEVVYGAVLKPLLKHVLAGGHATVFAFGQTGSGKTCTMAGHGDASKGDGNALGLYALAARDVMAAAGEVGCRLTVAFFEVYRGQVLDLLNQHSRLEVLEDGKGRVTVVGLREEPISSAEDILGFVRQAEELRAVGATSANEVSSRSHAILQVALYDAGDAARARGRLSLVDLAGSERAADASSKDRQTRLEGAEINKSLLCLKECIRAMDNGSSHTPFRGSKLTQVLREAFTGRAKTAMIATVSPGSSAAEYTLNTLRYASRVKETSDRKRASPAPGQKEPAAPDGRAHAEGPGKGPPPPLVARRPNPAPIAPSAENARAAPRTRTVTVSLEGAADGAAAVPASAPASAPASDSPRPATATPPPEADGAGSSRAASPAAEDGEAAAIEALGQSMQRDGALPMDDVVQEVRYLKAVAAVARTKEALVSEHRAVLELSAQLLTQERALLEEVGSGGGGSGSDACTVDEYTAALEQVVGEKLSLYSRLQGRLAELKRQLADEEALAAKVKPHA